MTNTTLKKAENFVWLTGRVLDQRRFDHLFGNGPTSGVLAALAAYGNADGGYGFALEPDCRGPGSQPITTHTALIIMAEVGALESDRAAAAVDYLGSVVLPDGSLPVVVDGLEGYPHAPWVVPDPNGQGSLLTTANVLGTLYGAGVSRPWMERAAEYCWAAIDALEKTHPYEAAFAVHFLDHVPDRDRAEKAAERLGTIVRDGNLVVLDHSHPERYQVEGYAPGEYAYAHDFASSPDSLARRWFSDAELAEALDHLQAEQRDDGGWDVTMLNWAPGTHLEWRPIATIGWLTVLQAYGRI